MRSRDRAMRSLARSVQASSAAASGSPEPKRAWKRKKRRIRKWSSAIRWSGSPMNRICRSCKVVEPAEIVENLAGQRIRRQRVDSEIAPRRVLLPVVGEGDRRPPPVGRHVASQARDFDDLAVADRGQSAMVDPGRDDLDFRLFQPLDDFLGADPRGEIDVAHREAQQLVADRSADIAGQPLVGAERIQQPAHALALAPFRRVERQLH